MPQYNIIIPTTTTTTTSPIPPPPSSSPLLSIINPPSSSQAIITSSLVEISLNSLRPTPRRLHLTPTHLLIQKLNQQESGDNDSTAPVHGSDTEEELFTTDNNQIYEQEKRVVCLERIGGILGMSVKGGWEHGLPLIVTRVFGEGARGIVRRGDAVLEINGTRLHRLTHDCCLSLLNDAGPTVELVVKYYPNTIPYLQTNNDYGNNESGDDYYETERAIPLTFALLTRYLKSTDQLRVNSFQVTDCSLNQTSGVVYPPTTHSLTYWIKSISDTISILNSSQLKQLSNKQTNILYSNWIWTGLQSSDPWINWIPKILTITNDYLNYTEYPPIINGGELISVPITCSLLRVLNASECLDERPHCFVIQLANNSCDGDKSAFQIVKKPTSYYCSTETRIELMRLESAWGRGVVEKVKNQKTTVFPVWWSGKPCQLLLNSPTNQFKLYKATTNPITSTTSPLWERHFSTLQSSTDDSKTKLTLKFLNGEIETMECSDLHRLLFSIHSWLLARVVQS